MKTISRKKPLPNIDRLHYLFDYDKSTGLLMWKVSRQGPVKAGDIVTTLNSEGYLIVGVDQVRLRVHRVAWAMHTGAWPTMEIDHINGVRTDNRVANMREIEHGANSQNLHGPQKNNTSGFLGVTGAQGRWQARITINKKNHHIGYFSTAETAHEAYLSMKRVHHAANTL